VEVINTVSEMTNTARRLKASGTTTGFVPTMGYLHEGHLSLVRLSRKETASTILSIFVNPTQFGPKEDLEKYPRDTEGDLEKCRNEGVDIVFLPEPYDMYPAGYGTYVDVEGVTAGLCGRSRPGHFRGVATVVNKLFNIVGPDKAYFGQKDFQQTAVIRRMVMDLNMAVDVVVAPTVREPDGLAMSSRNAYLNPDERRAAPVLHHALESARNLVEKSQMSTDALTAHILEKLREEPLIKPEYVEVVSPENLIPLSHTEKGAVIAIAVRIGGTRLIDNIIIS